MLTPNKFAVWVWTCAGSHTLYLWGLDMCFALICSQSQMWFGYWYLDLCVGAGTCTWGWSCSLVWELLLSYPPVLQPWLADSCAPSQASASSPTFKSKVMLLSWSVEGPRGGRPHRAGPRVAARTGYMSLLQGRALELVALFSFSLSCVARLGSSEPAVSLVCEPDD